MIRSLIVGLTCVDPATHGGWDGRVGCWGCDDDASTISWRAEQAGCSPVNQVVLLDERATRGEFSAIVRRMAEMSSPDDHTNIYYSGHGGQVRDASGDEEDGRDETMCFYDRDLADDALWELLRFFPSGSTVFLFSDSCHSGSNYRSQSRFLPFRFAPVLKPKLDCSLIHIAACRDSETAEGMEKGGAATLALSDAIRSGEGNSYQSLFGGMQRRLRGQHPVMTTCGETADFLLAKPFTGGHNGR